MIPYRLSSFRFGLFVLLSAVGLLFPAPPSSFKGFKSTQEAQAEFDRLYGGNNPDETAPPGNLQDHTNSISRFMDTLLAYPREKVLIVYGSPEERDAADILRIFINRKRGIAPEYAGQDTPALRMIEDNEADIVELMACRSFILGLSSDNRFVKSLVNKKKVNVSGNKAQYRLLERPNCVAIASGSGAMFVELVRVFLRSYSDFDENCYSYFFMN